MERVVDGCGGDLDASELYASVLSTNSPSRRMLEKAGQAWPFAGCVWP
jgi:hypothetical protein